MGSWHKSVLREKVAELPLSVSVDQYGTALFRFLWSTYIQGGDYEDFCEGLRDVHLNATMKLLSGRFAPEDIHRWFGSDWDEVVPSLPGVFVWLQERKSADEIAGAINVAQIWGDQAAEILDSVRAMWCSRLSLLSPNLVESIRNIHAELIVWLKKNPDALEKIAWKAFEELIAEVLASNGYDVCLTGQLRNRSADIIAIRTDELGVETRYLIECKRYAAKRKVGLDIVNSVLGAASRSGVEHALLVTSSTFTADVRRQESELRDMRLHLRDGEDVVHWLKQYRARTDGGLWLEDGWDCGTVQHNVPSDRL